MSVKGGADGRWLAITRSAGQGQPSASAVVTSPRDVRFMRVAARVRASGVRRGSEDWHLPGIFIHIRDGAGARVDRPTAPALLLERDTAAWTVMVSEFPVPRAGDVVQIHLTVCGPSGTLDVDDVVVEADPKRTSGRETPAALATDRGCEWPQAGVWAPVIRSNWALPSST